MERIEGKRARNVARTNRFLDARLRTIGLDTDALDAQMQERQAQAEREKVCGGSNSTIGGVGALSHVENREGGEKAGIISPWKTAALTTSFL